MKVTVKIWDALNSEEADAKEVEFDSWGWPFNAQNSRLQDLAKEFVEKRWADNDYLETTEINLRIADGEIVELIVYAEQAVTFRAAPRSR